MVRCSNDPLIGGDPTKPNPEDLLLSALAACHMLWYLHFASEAGVVVTGYVDDPIGLGETDRGGAGRFVSATLRPTIRVAAGTDLGRALSLHDRIHEVCFIARSLRFPVDCAPTFVVEDDADVE